MPTSCWESLMDTEKLSFGMASLEPFLFLPTPLRENCIFWLSDFTFTFHFHTLEEEMATHFLGSCLENPRDGGAWWAAIYGVAQNQTWLKRLSSSRSLWQKGFSGSSADKEPACLQCRRPGFDPWVGKIPWRRERLPTPGFWPGEFHGLYSPWGYRVGLHDWATFSFTYICICICSLKFAPKSCTFHHI